MTRFPVPRSGVRELEPYRTAEVSVPEGVVPTLLASNENPLGCSDAATLALESEARNVHRYPDGAATRLCAKIAAVHGIEANRIACGTGSDDLLHLLAQAYLAPGREAICLQPGFLLYPLAIRAQGARVVSVPIGEPEPTVEAILGAVTENTRMVFVANPNNPTGTLLSIDAVNVLVDGLRPDILLVLDAAYAEYVSHPAYDPGTHWAKNRENVVMTRTFSKIYGLAALRVGWLYGPRAVVETINTLRRPFNVSGPAQAAAEAALKDTAFVATSRMLNERGKHALKSAIAPTGRNSRLPVTPRIGEGNFALLEFAGASVAERVHTELMSRGKVLRRMGAYSLPHSLRTTIASENIMRALVRDIDEILSSTGVQGAARIVHGARASTRPERSAP